MKEYRDSVLPLQPNWKPEIVAEEILNEVERWYDQGWCFIKAEPDALWENIHISFERTFMVT